MKKNHQITQAEWPIMQALWARESATSAEIVRIITSQKNISMRTIKTLIRRLVAKGAVSYEVNTNDSRIYHYRAIVSQENCATEKTGALLDTVFANDMGDMLVRFVNDAKLNRGEIEKLEALLRQKKDELEHD